MKNKEICIINRKFKVKHWCQCKKLPSYRYHYYLKVPKYFVHSQIPFFQNNAKVIVSYRMVIKTPDPDDYQEAINQPWSAKKISENMIYFCVDISKWFINYLLIYQTIFLISYSQTLSLEQCSLTTRISDSCVKSLMLNYIDNPKVSAKLFCLFQV